MTLLISGAMGTYGQAITEIARNKGHKVLALGRNETQLKEKLSKGLIHGYFVMSADDFDRRSSEFDVWLGTQQIDCFIHCAGAGSKGSSLAKETNSAIQNAINVNVNYFFFLCQALMRSPSASLCSKVIAISSRRGSTSMAADEHISNAGCSYAYRIAKAAMNMTVCCLQEEFLQTGPTFNAIHPGKLISKMGVNSADVEPLESAKRLFDQVIETELSFGYYTLQDTKVAKLPW